VEETDGSWGGNEDTSKYDFAQPWSWQELTAIWRPKPGDAKFGLAIEKGGTDPAGIDAEISDWTVEAVPVP
jgi:hypothetical protein